MVEMLLLLVATILHILDRGIYYAQLIVFHLLVCIRNAKKLWYMLIHGTKTWIYMLGRLILFTIVLAPGWYQFLKYFFFDSFILRNIEYGKGSKFRNVMDIYLPLPMDVLSQLRNDAKSYPDGAPVVIFVSGGAWIIGYKLWSALVGRALACFGVLTIVPDYRNFPQGDIADMTQDIKNAILWVEANCSRFGGNPNKIVLAGQSAGAHICLCLLVEEYLGMKIPKTEEEYYVEKLNMNYKVFDTIIDVKSPVKAVVTSSEKHAHHHNGSQHHAVPSPAKINKNDHPVSSKVVDRSVNDYIADDNNDDDDDDDDVDESTSEDDGGEDTDNVTPIHGLGEDDSYLSAESGFKDFPIFPMKERQNLERLILHQAMGSEGNDPHDPPDSLSSFENTSQWFDTPFEAKGNHTPSTHSYHSKGKSSNADELPIIQEQVNPVEEEDEELNESIWREVIDTNDSHAHTANEQQHSAEKTIPNNNNNHNSSQKKKRKNSPSSASSQYIHLQKKLQKLHARHHQHQTNILNKVKLFIGVSGPYNLQALESHLHKRGLDSSILHWICRGNLSESSPTVRLQQYVIQEFTKLTQNNANNNSNNSNNNNQENSQIDQQPQPVTAYEVATVTDITTSSTAPNNGNNSNNNNNNSSISPANAMKSSWRIVNFIQSEINLYVSKLFQPINNSSLNSNDDVIVGQAFNYLQAHQHYLKEKTNLLSDFIPVALFHGSLDVSIPESISEELAEVLTDHGAQIVYKAYPDWNHTDAILEAPLYGNTKLFKDMIRIIRHVTDTHQSLDVLKGGVGNGNHITSLNRKRSLSFPSDLHAKNASTMSIAYPVIDKGNNKDEEHGKTQKKGIKPNPSETPMAPRFLLDIGRKLNPF